MYNIYDIFLKNYDKNFFMYKGGSHIIHWALPQ